jgi:hypothetical protein
MPVIRYEFLSSGADKVKDDLAQIAARGKQVQQQSRTMSAGRSAGGSSQAAQERAERSRAAQAERESKRRQSAVEREERAKTRTVEREEKRRELETVRASKRKAREEERVERQRQQSAIRERTKAAREQAKIEKRFTDKAGGKLLERAQNAWRAKGAFAGSLVAGGARATGSGALTAIKGAAAVTGIIAGVGGAVAGASTRQRLSNEQKALALSKAGRGAGEKAVDPKTLLREAEAVAGAVKGTEASNVLDAQQKFVAMTGDLKQARALSKTFALTARASGGSEEDMASAMATLRDKFGITDEAGMQDAMAKLIFQGKKGSFEMSDLAQYATEMGAAGARFGLDKGAKGAATLGGLAQIARMSTGSGAEASTGVMAMLRQLTAQSDRVKKLTGAEVFTDKTRTKARDIQDVLVDTIAGAQGDQVKLQKIFGEEGMKGASRFISTYNEAQNALGPNATAEERKTAGSKAVKGLMDEFINAPGDWSEVQKDADLQSTSTLDSLTSSWESTKNIFGEALAPAVEAMVAVFESSTSSVEAFAAIFGDLFGAVADFITFLQDKGLLAKDEEKKAPKTLEEAAYRRQDVETKLDELKSTEGKHKLTSAQRLEKRKLEQEKIGLDQFVGDQDVSSILAKRSNIGGGSDDQSFWKNTRARIANATLTDGMMIPLAAASDIGRESMSAVKQTSKGTMPEATASMSPDGAAMLAKMFGLQSNDPNARDTSQQQSAEAQKAAADALKASATELKGAALALRSNAAPGDPPGVN